MKLLILAVDSGGVWGLSPSGQFRRLESVPSESPLQPGEVWELEVHSPSGTEPLPDERVVVSQARCRGRSPNPKAHLQRLGAVHDGEADGLFPGNMVRLDAGRLGVASTTSEPAARVWQISTPLQLSDDRNSYHLGAPENGVIAYAGSAIPREVVGEGSLLLVTLTPPAEIGVARTLQIEAIWPSSTPTTPAGVGDPREVLQRVFGYREFRPLQERVIQSVLAGRDSLAIMPTGSGKSLCFQLPTLMRTGLTVVVSPLIALMEDQVNQLTALGIPAAFLNSTLDFQQRDEIWRRAEMGELQFLYCAPESLVRSGFQESLSRCRVELLAIDEAHCISEWGHDFRPEYRMLGAVRRGLSGATCLALTATATPRVRDDIRTQLGIPSGQLFLAGFDRPNLFLAVRRKVEGRQLLLEMLGDHQGESGIIYCATRDQVDRLTAWLVEAGVPALAYHAGMSDRDRRENQRRFLHEDATVLVATVAFGMGVNKPNVRFVTHYSLPDCLETYYQQVGRAGRDGLPARCTLLFDRNDTRVLQGFIDQGAQEEKAGRTRRLEQMLRFVVGRECRRAVLLPYFGDPPPAGPCGGCDVCNETAETRGDDASEPARRYLACVAALARGFGHTHITEVLRGANTERVRRWKHVDLPVYGSGKDLSLADWRQISISLLEAHALVEDATYGTLTLGPEAGAVLAGGPIYAPLKSTSGKSEGGKRDRSDRARPAPGGPEAALFDALKILRRTLAQQAGVPPYVIFSDRTLLEMAQQAPRTPEALLTIHGIGEHKAATYGPQFLAEIEDHLAFAEIGRAG